jgi:hypothetical protein
MMSFTLLLIESRNLDITKSDTLNLVAFDAKSSNCGYQFSKAFAFCKLIIY